MPSELTAAINFNNLRSIVWPLEVLGSLTGGVYAGVFEQDDSIWSLFCHYLLVDISLKLKSLVIGDKVWIEPSNHEFRHMLSLRVIPSLTTITDSTTG
jgi:hypothetical protein